MFEMNNFPHGNFVLYRNVWSGFDSPEISEMFRLMNTAEISSIRFGEIIWHEYGSIHPKGGVYGFRKLKVTGYWQKTDGSRKMKLGSEWITISAGNENPFLSFYTVTDEARLAELVAANPLATEVYHNREAIAI